MNWELKLRDFFKYAAGLLLAFALYFFLTPYHIQISSIYQKFELLMYFFLLALPYLFGLLCKLFFAHLKNNIVFDIITIGALGVYCLYFIFMVVSNGSSLLSALAIIIFAPIFWTIITHLLVPFFIGEYKSDDTT